MAIFPKAITMTTTELRKLAEAMANPQAESIEIPELSQTELTILTALMHQLDTINATVNLTGNLVKAILSMAAALDRNTISHNGAMIRRG